jgi:hypothetical protein
MTDYRTINHTLTAGDVGELFDLDLSEAFNNINLDAEQMRHYQYTDEIRHGWQNESVSVWMADADGHVVADEAAMALRLGKIMLEAIKIKMMEDI